MNMKQRRDSFIRELCNYVNSDTGKQTSDIRPTAEEWGFSKVELDNFIEYFKEKFYIKTGGLGDFYYRLSITTDGIDYIENIDCESVP